MIVKSAGQGGCDAIFGKVVMQRGTDLQRVFLSRRSYDASELDGRAPPPLSFDQGLALHFGSENQK